MAGTTIACIAFVCELTTHKCNRTLSSASGEDDATSTSFGGKLDAEDDGHKRYPGTGELLHIDDR